MNHLLERFVASLASVCLRLFNTNLTGLRFHLDQYNHKMSLQFNANAYNFNCMHITLRNTCKSYIPLFHKGVNRTCQCVLIHFAKRQNKMQVQQVQLEHFTNTGLMSHAPELYHMLLLKSQEWKIQGVFKTRNGEMAK